MNLIRNVAGLFIILLLLPILLMAFRYTSKLPFAYTEVYDELTLMQLRESLLISYNLAFDERELSFILHNREFRLSLVNDKLIMQPGTQIFLAAGAEGFHIDRFSDCNVRDDESDRSEG